MSTDNTDDTTSEDKFIEIAKSLVCYLDEEYLTQILWVSNGQPMR